jgi:hypothetical protein
MTAETILVLVNVGLWIVLFLFFRSRFSPSHILREIRIEVDKLVTEISRETDRDIALIEGRIRGLKALIEEADKRILLADRESRRRAADDRVYADLAAIREDAAIREKRHEGPKNNDSAVSGISPVTAASADADAPTVPVMPVGEALSRYRKSGKTPQSGTAYGTDGADDPADTLPREGTELLPQDGDVPETPEVVSAPQPVTPKVPVREQVIYLARTGFPAEMIAERLSLTISEVELTIALYAGEI